MGRLYAYLAQVLAGMSPPVLEKSATVISNLIKRPVAASSGSILGAIKGWVGANPVKAGIASSALVSAGVELAADQLSDAFGEEAANPQVAALLTEIGRSLISERQLHVGDGKPLTAHGMSEHEFLQQQAGIDVIYQKVARGIAAVGSLKSLKAIRDAVFLEDADFRLYEQRKRNLAGF